MQVSFALERDGPISLPCRMPFESPFQIVKSVQQVKRQYQQFNLLPEVYLLMPQQDLVGSPVMPIEKYKGE